jgi:hypothetical protein
MILWKGITTKQGKGKYVFTCKQATLPFLIYQIVCETVPDIRFALMIGVL